MLKERGLHYEVAAFHDNRKLPNIPDSKGNKISFLERDVILIRCYTEIRKYDAIR